MEFISSSKIFEDRQWKSCLIGDDYRWLDSDGKRGRDLDARTYFFCIAIVPGKGWFACLRLYGPHEAWFDKSWRSAEVELVK